MNSDIAKYNIEHAKSTAEKAIAMAIDQIRRMLVDAERAAARADRPLSDRIEDIHHTMAWGVANLQTTLATAQRYAIEHAVESARLSNKGGN